MTHFQSGKSEKSYLDSYGYIMVGPYYLTNISCWCYGHSHQYNTMNQYYASGLFENGDVIPQKRILNHSADL